MKIILNSRIHYCVARVSIFLLVVALIAGTVGCGGNGGGEAYTLTIAVTSGGSVTEPGEGTFTYDERAVVDLVAKAEKGYYFLNWTGNASTIANVNSRITTITMCNNYSITANFELIPPGLFALTISSSAGGSVTVPGEATFIYDEGTVVDLVATPHIGYYFADWTGDVDGIANVEVSATNITMNGHYEIIANFAPFAGGSGIEEDPYQIANWYQLHEVRNYLDSYFILVNKLDYATTGYTELASPTANDGKGWQPIGTQDHPFKGSFDGQEYEIRDLFINRPGEVNVGLFGRVGEGGVIKNVGVVDVNVTSGGNVGGLVGENSGTVSDCYATGNVIASGGVGALVGDNYYGTVSNSYATGSVIGNNYVGGLVGDNEGTISNSYATGSVTGNNYVGGLVGDNPGTVSSSYSTGSVTGNSSVGGLVGGGWGTVSNSFWDTETSGQSTSAGGTGKNTIEMQDIATFSGATWDIVAVANPSARNPSYIWNIVDDETYPFLSWQLAWLEGYDYRKQIKIEGTTAGAQTDYQMQLIIDRTYPIKLTLLNARSSKAFTIAGGSGWTEQDFGSTVPSNTKMALIMVKSTTRGDINFKAKSTDTTCVTISLGSDPDYFDGSFFVIVPVSGGKVWTKNAGASGSFDVYVVGYITEETEGDTFFELFNENTQVVSAKNPKYWTTVDISSLKQENGDKTIKGAYIAVDSNADQDLYFRASGSSESGVLWQSDTNDPGTHLLGFIPVGSNGKFQYKTGGKSINIYVLGLIESCPAAQSDKMVDYTAETIGTMYADGNWHTITPDWLGAKAYYVTGIRSPNALNTFKTRPYGSSMTQSYLKKDSCGGNPILTKPGTDNKIEYWSDAYANGYIYCNSITIFSASFNPDGGNCFIDNSQCQADFDDIHFTKSDGETELDYWRESYTDERITFWIEFDSIPASPNSATFYMYYGNSGAGSGSNGNNTFPFFDDFEDGSIDSSKWTQKSSGVYSETNGYLQCGSGADSRLIQNSTNYPWFSPGCAIRHGSLVSAVDSVSGGVGFAKFSADWGTFYGHALSPEADMGSVTQIQESGYENTDNLINPTAYCIYDILWKSGQVKYYQRGTLRATHTTYVPSFEMGVYIFAYSTTLYTRCYWVFVRKYVDPEPTWGSW